MNGKLNAFAFGGAAALTAALSMLVLGLLGNLGIYTGAVTMMGKWHMFFSLTFFGILSGMLEAAIITYVLIYIFSLVHNKLV